MAHVPIILSKIVIKHLLSTLISSAPTRGNLGGGGGGGTKLGDVHLRTHHKGTDPIDRPILRTIYHLKKKIVYLEILTKIFPW